MTRPRRFDRLRFAGPAVLLLGGGQVLAIVGAGHATDVLLWAAAVVTVALAASEPSGDDTRMLPWVAASAACGPVLAAIMAPSRVLAIAAAGLPPWAGVELLSVARAGSRLAGAPADRDDAEDVALDRVSRVRVEDLGLVGAVAAPVVGVVVLAALVDVGGGLVLVGLGGAAAIAGRGLLATAGRRRAAAGPAVGDGQPL